MAGVFVNEGELVLANRLWQGHSDDMKLHLFKNNITPTALMTVASVTEAEATVTGYAAETLDKDNWENAVVSGGRALSIYDTQLEFTNSGATTETIYGYYGTTADSATLLFIERFSTTIVWAPTESILITPKLTMNSL